jgi:hypothetical protein
VLYTAKPERQLREGKETASADKGDSAAGDREGADRRNGRGMK